MGKRNKSKETSNNKHNNGDENEKRNQDEPIEERFIAAETRPQFRTSKQKTAKVVLDERFSSVLTDPRFQLQGKDKYGRKKKKKQHEERTAKEELKSFYIVQEHNNGNVDDDDDNEMFSKLKDRKDNHGIEKSEKNKTKKLDGTDQSDSDDDESNEQYEEDKDKVEDPASRIAYLTAFSRGEIDVSSSSEDDDEFSQSSDEDELEDGEEDPVHGNIGILDPSNQEKEEVEISFDPSPYLVVTNMDWENIRAVDLFCVLSSFAPPGALKKVQVYQSDFGRERMEKDKLYGPSDIWKKKKRVVNRNVQNDSKVDESTNGSIESEGDEASSGEDDIAKNFDEIQVGQNIREEGMIDESDFDPEKLRAYEASKLKYFFAVVELVEASHADLVYNEVDGMEFEHSSAAIDLRTLPPEEFTNLVSDRPLRDEATNIPGNYEPPEFVVSALQQTNVQCTWEQGDVERERKLTKYGGIGWRDEIETDDLKAYLASDVSSDDDSVDDDKRVKNGSRIRKLLGLDSDDDTGNNFDISDSHDDPASENEVEESSSDDIMSKEIRLIPGKKDLEDKIRTRISNTEAAEELTPWQKCQEKWKQKRKERRQAARGNQKQIEVDTSSSNSNEIADKNDSFFTAKDDTGVVEDTESEQHNVFHHAPREQRAKAELELLMAGEHDEENARDYDIRGLLRMEKIKGKKLKGSRKRKEAKIAADVSGTDFKVDVYDDRFKAVLDGSDGRFGIDKTDPSYKDTSAMRDILSEQVERRKKKRQKMAHDEKIEIVPDVDADNAKQTRGASALSSLVQRLKTQVEHGNNS